MNVITNNNSKYTIALAALQNVVDPEIGLNIVDLGLIYQIDFEEANSRIYVSMTLTTQFCLMGESISGAVKRVLENTFAGMEVRMELTFGPLWSQEMISEEGKKFLNQKLC